MKLVSNDNLRYVLERDARVVAPICFGVVFDLLKTYMYFLEGVFSILAPFKFFARISKDWIVPHLLNLFLAHHAAIFNILCDNFWFFGTECDKISIVRKQVNCLDLHS